MNWSLIQKKAKVLYNKLGIKVYPVITKEDIIKAKNFQGTLPDEKENL